MRILHLIDATSPAGGPCLMRLAAEPVTRIRSIEHVVFIVGHGAAADVAAQCGLSCQGRLNPVARTPVLSRHQLVSAIRDFHAAGRPIDLIHAWTPESALLALSIGASIRVLVTLPLGPISGLSTQALVMALEQQPSAVTALSSAIASEWALVGIDPATVHVLPPAVNPSLLESDEAGRISRRRRWEAGSRTLVVGVLGEPAPWTDSRAAASAGVIAALAGHDVRLVMHSETSRRRETQAWLGEIGEPQVVVIDDDVAFPWRLAHALDAGLMLSPPQPDDEIRSLASPFAVLLGGGRSLNPASSVLPLLWASASALPIVASSQSSLSGILEDGVNALLAQPGDVNRAADRLMRLCEDRQLAGRLGAGARDMVSRRFNVSAFCVRLKEVYLRLSMDRPIAVVGAESGDDAPV